MRPRPRNVAVHPSPRRRSPRRGLGMVELMISLAITAMLLVAIAVAFVSSSQVIENNDRFFRATQGARVAMAQMLTEVRRSDSIPMPGSTSEFDMSADCLPIMRPPEAPKQPNEELRVYEYDPVEKRINLFFRYLDGSKSPKYPIARNVQSSPFQWDPGKDAEGFDCVARVSITLEVAVEKQTITLTGAAAPRRSLTFK